MKKYEAPRLFVDLFAADTMIASGGPKNGNADNNQNCAGCDTSAYSVSGENVCIYVSGTDAYNAFCR